MPAFTLRNSLAAVLAVGLLPLLAGCGGSSGKDGADSSAADSGTKTTTAADGTAQLNVPDGADDATKKQYLSENAIAACMKKQGFTYTPHVDAPTTGKSFNIADGEDYASAKKYRQKYGFGYYSAAVYPGDPNNPLSRNRSVQAPSDDDQKGFTPAQLKAYQVALAGPPAKSKAEEKPGGCSEAARVLVYGPALSAAAEKKKEKAASEKNRENGLALNGDAQLVQLAQKYATCLTGQGITVTTTQPTGMAEMVRLNAADKLPETFHNMSKEAALPLLTKEIDLALKDLECGKEFRVAYFPKAKANPYYRDEG